MREVTYRVVGVRIVAFYLSRVRGRAVTSYLTMSVIFCLVYSRS